MGIKAVHIGFVSICSTLSLALAVWRYGAWSAGAGTAVLFQALGAAAFALAAVVYGVFFLRKLKGIGYLSIAALGLMMLADPHAAEACAVCFGDPQSPLTKGMTSGVLFLLGCICTVLSAFAGTFLYWMRRHRFNEAASLHGMVN